MHPCSCLPPGIALATPFLAWFVIGDLSFGGSGGSGLSHFVGPFDVGPASSYVICGPAAVVAAVALGVLIIRTRQRVADWRSWAVVTALAGAGTVAAFGWRIETAAYVGGPLGAGMVEFFGPGLITALLVLAVWLDGGGGRRSLRRTWELTLAALLAFPALNAVLLHNWT